ncbi:DUF4192 domain-containing protein [Arthrobacter sp. CDRTa11]|uniref:DUF4192 domain-containing protein n=1 Tax=Arthrobacter sp. CDRTa11 TaxID=2651199 RepID=UPI002265BF64|nr:DUF4192 domain-containing protein [Arthrobacter sp. CDRTa11]UZX02826.1 DUF4192 domain-containing protein [Arthrobacter sp. CDRTa11]
MESLSIKTPADVLSFVGHTLGFWPKESLVCITLNHKNMVGATLRVDLPKSEEGLFAYAQTVAGYIQKDANASTVLFAVYTEKPWEIGEEKPQAHTVAALTGALAQQGISIRDGLLVGNEACLPYDGDHLSGPSIPLAATQSSEINAEFVYRGSQIEPQGIRLPASTKETLTTDAVLDRMEEIRRLPAQEALDEARALWGSMLQGKTYPTDEETVSLIASFQFAGIRDRLMADIPGIDEPMVEVLLAQTEAKPQWSRVEWAQQLLLHAYTHSSTQHSAALLTTVGYINWWEGRGSKAHQFLQLALEADPAYRLARLSDQMVAQGMLAPWSTDRNKAYGPRGLEAS